MPTRNAFPDESLLAAHIGAPHQRVALGSNGSCWRVTSGERRLIVKRMPASRPLTALRAVWSTLGPERCPQLLDHIEPADGRSDWWAMFPDLGGSSRPTWSSSLLARLPELWACEARVEVDLVEEWITRLSDARLGDAAAELLRRRLFATRPVAATGLAHGDFAPQNLLFTSHGAAVLVDWEQCGRAPAAFDAGTLAALARARFIVGEHGEREDVLRSTLLDLGLDAALLRWFEGLGLLRLLYRVRSGAVPANVQVAAATRLRAAVLQLLDECPT